MLKVTLESATNNRVTKHGFMTPAAVIAYHTLTLRYHFRVHEQCTDVQQSKTHSCVCLFT